MLNRLFDKLNRKQVAPEVSQLKNLREGLDCNSEDDDLAKVYPQIMPFSLVGPSWPGPIEPLGDLPFGISWAVADPENYFRYVSWDMSQFWESTGTNWRAVAMENLKELSRSYPYAGVKEDSDGRIYLLSLLSRDSMGPSRLLVPGLFKDMFGENYTVAIPERTCGVVFRNGLEGEEELLAKTLVDECFRVGTEPMSNERFDPKRFWVL
jgi:hypothetical protein